jgi:hypothetical protein
LFDKFLAWHDAPTLRPNQLAISAVTALVALGVSLIVALILFLNAPTPIHLIAEQTIIRFEFITALLSMGIGLLEYGLLSRAKTQQADSAVTVPILGRHLSLQLWLEAVIVSFSVAWIMTSACRILLDFVLPDATLSTFGSILLYSLYGALIGFTVAIFSLAISNKGLNLLLGFLMTVGLLYCILILAADRSWLQRSVSYLGSADRFDRHHHDSPFAGVYSGHAGQSRSKNPTLQRSSVWAGGYWCVPDIDRRIPHGRLSVLGFAT